jgi:GT2 family glycosyltransferase
MQDSRLKTRIFFIQNEKNEGFAEGNNIGIRQALENGNDYIFTLNNDTEVDPQFLSEAIKVTEDSNRRIGMVATTMVNYNHRTKLDNTGHLLLTTGDTVPRDRGMSSPPFKGGGEQRERGVEKSPFGACAGAALYSSEMLKDIGLFDKDFFLNYEDSDLSLRGIVQGWQCIHSPKSIIYHKINSSIGKIKNDTYRIRSLRNQLWAYTHNTPLFVIVLNLPWIILRDLLVIVTSIITLRWKITYIFIASRFAFLKSLPVVLKKRHKVLKHQKVSSWWYWQHQTSWFSTYWKYFKEIVMKRRDSVMEA